MRTAFALDTETTGLSAKTEKVIEIAVVEFDLDTGIPTGVNYTTRLNPGKSVHPEASKVNGLTLEDLLDEPVFSEIAHKFLEVIKGQTLYIHNAPFDVGFLDMELASVGLPSITTVAAEIVDTRVLAKQALTLESYSLDALCKHYNVDNTGRTIHGALIDCNLLAAVSAPLVKEAGAKTIAEKAIAKTPVTKTFEEKAHSEINSILSFDFDSAIPEELDVAAAQSIELCALIKKLEARKKLLALRVGEIVQKTPTEGEFFTVSFDNRELTDWKKVKSDLLADADLSPYISVSSAMFIKAKAK